MSSSEAWEKLKSFTNARIALDRMGSSLSTQDVLRFRTDHALARDAVWTDVDWEKIVKGIEKLNCPYLSITSGATDREEFIQRPDLGRKLDALSTKALQQLNSTEFELSISVADGLSAVAIEKHAVPFLQNFLSALPYNVAPITLVKQGRVAISDAIGEFLGCKIAVILIGERPGLSTADSMGIYMTYGPQVGNTDERRNCISNISKEGLSYKYAAEKLTFLISEAMRRKLSGVHLKDNFNIQHLNNGDRKK